jgi:UDP-glucose:(heptosyl)LPS alpha-1,3-glucosyltransferase
MRLAFLYRRLAREGGTEADLFRTAAGLSQRGHDVHLFCAEVRTAPPDGVSVHRVPVARAGRLVRLLTFAWAAPRVAARGGPWDVIVGFGRIPRQHVVRCGGGTHHAYLATMQQFGARRRTLGPYHRAILWLEARQFRPGNFRRVLAVSGRVRDEVASAYDVGAERIDVVYNGVDLERFCPDRLRSRRAVVRRRLGIGDEERVVVSVGSGFRRKGIDGLLRLWETGPENGPWLVVVGGDERLTLYRRAVRASKRVVFTGPQPVVEDFYAAADAVVVASLQEAFGNVVLEGLAAGLPVVTSTRVGAAELLDGPLRSLVAPAPDDLAGIAERLALALGPAGRDLGRLGRQAAERHPWSSYFVGLERVLGLAAGAGP